MSKEYSILVVLGFAVYAVAVAFFIRYKIEFSDSLKTWIGGVPVALSILIALKLGISNPLILGVAVYFLILETLYFISPSNKWPKLYIRFLQIGWGLFTILFWAWIVRDVIHPSSLRTGIPYSFMIPGIIAWIILAIADIFLRPRGRPREGIF